MDQNAALKENRQYDLMLSSIAERLKKLDIEGIAKSAGLLVRENTIEFESFGEKGILYLPGFTASENIEMWQHLAVLQFLEAYLGEDSGESWISLSELEDSDVSRSASFDKAVRDAAASGLTGVPRDIIAKEAESLGGKVLDGSKADMSIIFYFLPKYPLLLNIWLSDDEFPASAKVLINASLKSVLGLEAAGTIARLLVKKLCERCSRKE